MCHCLAGLQNQLNALARGGCVLVAPALDRQALDVLHHHVWLAVGQQAAIDHAGNAGVFQHRQDAAFGQETLAVVAAWQSEALQRGALFVLAVGAFHFVDLAHAAASQRAHHAPCAGKFAGLQGGLRHGVAVAFQPAGAGVGGSQ